jgi:hypothetical protein
VDGRFSVFSAKSEEEDASSGEKTEDGRIARNRHGVA